MSTPTDRRYAETHEWHLLEDGILTLGLTQHAVDQLTDVTYVELRDTGTELSEGDPVGEVESVKTTSDVYSALPGEIIEHNDAAIDNPGLLNDDPYGAGWLLKIRVSDESGYEALADSTKYDAEYAQ